MADQEQVSNPTGEPAPSPGATTPPGAPSAKAADQAGDPAAALDAAQAAIDDLSAESATPPHGGAEDGAAEALKAAQETLAAAKSVGDAPTAGGEDASPVAMPELQRPPAPAGSPVPAAPGELNLLSDVNLHVTIELGRTRMLVEDVLRLGEGSVVELDKPAGDPVDVYVNDRHVARGEVLVVNENFCVRISEIIETGAGAEGDRAAR